VLGSVVIGGMLAATILAIFFIPVSFDVVERFGLFLAGGKKKDEPPPPNEPTGTTTKGAGHD